MEVFRDGFSLGSGRLMVDLHQHGLDGLRVKARMPGRPFSRLFVVLVFVSSMGAVDALTRPYLDPRNPDVVSTQIPLSTQVIESGVYLCVSILVLARWRRVAIAARSNWPLLGLVALSLLSIAWSIDSSLTLRRSVALFLSTLLGIYLGERFTTEQLAQLLAQAMCFMMVSAVVLYFVAPSYVIDYSSYGGAWRGLSVKKNSFGAYMAMAVVLFLLIRFRHFRWLRYAVLALSVVLLLLSRSATSLLCCAIAILLLPLWGLTRIGGKQRFLVYTLVPAALFIAIYFLLSNAQQIFLILGRDPTFTGRTQLWGLVVSAIKKHPIAGYGYGAFWSGMSGEAMEVYIASKWLPTAAHNGYLELGLSFGIIGLPLLLWLIIHSLRLATTYLREHKGALAFWPISYITFLFLDNFFESRLLETRALELLVFVAITTAMGMEHCRTQLRARPIRSYALVDHKDPSYSGMAT
jgi:exopolysaccharide production protein ExoQ